MIRLFLSSFALISFADMGWAGTLGEVVRAGDNRAVMMTFAEANAHCRANDSRLPTAREFAEYAVELGAAGIRETQLPDVIFNDSKVQAEIAAQKLERFEVITTSSRNSEPVVDFYYSLQGFVFQEPESSYAFWSSSVYPEYRSSKSYKAMWSWVGSSGNFIMEWTLADRKQAVRCILN